MTNATATKPTPTVRYEAREISAKEEPGIQSWQVVKIYAEGHPMHEKFPDGQPSGKYFQADAIADAEKLNIQAGHAPAIKSHDDALKDEHAANIAERGKERPWDRNAEPKQAKNDYL